MNKKLRKENILKKKAQKDQYSQHMACYSNGITLVALIITIIVLLILAVVTIRAVTGDGILAQARNARDKWKEAQRNEEIAIDQLADSINGQTTTGYNEEKKVNAPELKTGMVPVKYVDNAWVVTTKDDPEWYNYSDTELTIGDKTIEDKKWANVMLRDGLKVENQDASTASLDSMSGKKVSQEGSMFVWIPRFAYKLTKLQESAYKVDKVSGENKGRVTDGAGTIDVVFLQGNTDYYGAEKAKRGNIAEQDYVVHPSFINDVNLGGWDRELTGYWVAKFEAAYSDAESAENSTVKYTKTLGYNGATNTQEDILNNYYGEKQIADSALTGANDIGKPIKYPTFTGNRPSFNYISIGDSFSLCSKLNASGNPYRIDGNSDTHLIKNSEWGAVAYLGQSQYGKGSEIVYNNVMSATDASTNSQKTVWATTGGGDYEKNTVQSSTGNIYGIYDLSGGLLERVAGYVNNANVTNYGASMKVESSTKYVTVYKTGTSDARVPNYLANTEFYGDAIIETSSYDETKTGTDDVSIYYNYCTSWFHNLSVFPFMSNSFFMRGGAYYSGENAGSFAFSNTLGYLNVDGGFRAVLV